MKRMLLLFDTFYKRELKKFRKQVLSEVAGEAKSFHNSHAAVDAQVAMSVNTLRDWARQLISELEATNDPEDQEELMKQIAGLVQEMFNIEQGGKEQKQQINEDHESAYLVRHMLCAGKEIRARRVNEFPVIA